MVSYSISRDSELIIGSVRFGGEDGSVRVYAGRLLVARDHD